MLMKYFMLFFYKLKSFDFKLIFSFLAITVVLSQFALSNNSFRGYLTGIDLLEGTVPASSESIVEPCEFDLNLVSGEPSKDIIVLVNGEPYCKFDKEKVSIKVKHQSVIEILNNTTKSVTVYADNFSDNGTVTLNNGRVKVEKISLILRIVPD